MKHLLCCFALAACARGPDTSTPKMATKAYLAALHQGDAKTALALSAASTDGEKQVVKAAAAFQGGLVRVAEAAQARFGPEAGHDVLDKTRRLIRSVDTAVQEVDGDTAVLRGLDEEEPVVLKRIVGKWKVEAHAPGEVDPRQGIEYWRRVEDVSRRATEEVVNGLKAGRYASESKAWNDFTSRTFGEFDTGYAEARVRQAKTDLHTLDNCIDLYKVDFGRYPTTNEGLKAIVAAGKCKAGMKDPWGHDYVYRYPGTIHPKSYDLMSYGADGQPGGEGVNADIIYE